MPFGGPENCVHTHTEKDKNCSVHGRSHHCNDNPGHGGKHSCVCGKATWSV